MGRGPISEDWFRLKKSTRLKQILGLPSSSCVHHVVKGWLAGKDGRASTYLDAITSARCEGIWCILMQQIFD